MKLPSATGVRRGLSLLEVLVAVAVLLLSLAAISRLLSFGADRAVDIRFQSRAGQLCQSKMSEIVAGIVPLTSQSDVPVDEDPDWRWSMTANSGSVTGLYNVTVRVGRDRPDGSHFEMTLSRMVLDPSMRGAAGTGSTSASGGSTTGQGTSSTVAGP